MKNKFALLLFCIVLGLSVMQSLFAVDKTTNREDILLGEFDDGVEMRSIIILPVEAIIDNNNLIVNFDDEAGKVEISVRNEQGVVLFTQSNNITAAQAFTFNMAGAEKGTYTVSIKFTELGKSLRGVFEVR